MKIKTITRLISGNSFDHNEATATIDEGEDVIEAFKTLDITLKQSLIAINLEREVVREQQSEKAETVSLLKEALEYVEEKKIPF